ncbi:DUF2971 domain-containing protein [Treponema bryantii]|uniref:DUF2971 domain-containing protein n=1 Tax=Treponema bryantii TaxID=163 RepID=UPI0003B4B263|nr:DUF2971 domain-containing protein [Treponema bryantii]
MKKEYLFHYTSLDKCKSIINSHELWFNKISQTNDPYENKKFDFFEKSELADIGLDELDYNSDEVDEQAWFFQYLTQTKNRMVKSFSFSSGEYVDFSVNNRPGYFLPRMWAQYGENSKGACLVFNKNKLLTKLKSDLEPRYYFFAENVDYKDITDKAYSSHMRKIIISRNKKIFGHGRCKNEQKVRDNLCENIRDYYYTKDIDWQGENEFRIIIINKKGNSNTEIEKVKIDLADTLECVILGENLGFNYTDSDYYEINKNDIYKMKKFCEERNIDIKMLKRDIYRSTYLIEDLFVKPVVDDSQPFFDGWE